MTAVHFTTFYVYCQTLFNQTHHHNYKFVITKNEEETKFNYSKSISLNFDLKNLLISGYYNLNDEDMQEFTTAKYNLKDGNYKCDDSNCNLLKNEILTFIDEVNNILDDCHKTLNDFQK